MSKRNNITWIILLLLTLATALIAGMGNAAYLILGISAMKFLLVAFQFMELKNAHSFWKVSLVIILAFTTGIILILAI